MGLAVWVGSGLLAFVIARIIPLRRSGRRGIESLLAIAVGLAGGVAATALDFGGWREPDWRAALFAFLLAFAAIGVARLMKRDPDAHAPRGTSAG